MQRVLVLFTALTLALTLAVGAAGRSEAVFVPETLTHRAPVGSQPVATPFGIDHLGVLWDVEGGHDHGGGADGDGGEAAYNVDGREPNGAVRFRDADGEWGRWIRLLEDGAEGEGHWASGLVAADGAVAYQVRGLPDGAGAPRAVAMNVTDGPPVEVGRRPAGAAGALTNCLSRAEWGADEELRFDDAGTEIWPPAHYAAQVLTAHHTATTNDDSDPAGRVRAIYQYHAVDRGWGDIGYHYLIDEDGRVYEGRWSGEASTLCGAGGDGADFAHDTADGLVTAAHTGGSNSGNAGVALLGEFTTHPRFGAEPKAAAVDALEGVLAELAGRHTLDPLGTVDYVNPVNGATKAGVDTISGHRDWTATECPGERLYDQLPQIRENVALAVGADPDPAVAVTIDEPADGSTFASGASITFAATAETGAQVTWASDVDGELGTGDTITTTLRDGAHDVTATATLDGATGQDAVSVTVGDAPAAPTVSVVGIQQAADGNRHLLVDVHTADDSGAPVAGATVTAEVWHADPDGTPTTVRETVTGTTSDSGTVSFRVRVKAKPPGCYTTIVTDVGHAEATWDGVSPAPDEPDPYCF